MIAEIYGKISSSGSNLSDRMEDKLTGDFFGNLRYLPYEKGFKILLDKIIIHSGKAGEIVEKISYVKNTNIADKVNFWPKCKDTNTELDMSINLETLYIGIEVKYNSGLSSEDQLLRELKAIDIKRNNKKALFIFISQAKGIIEAIDAIGKLGEDSYLLDNIGFAYITWEDIHQAFTSLNLENYNVYQRLIIEDIKRLLIAKNLGKFNSFKLDEKYNIQDKTFKFDFKIKANFNFQFEIEIIEEDFYEFR